MQLDSSKMLSNLKHLRETLWIFPKLHFFGIKKATCIYGSVRSVISISYCTFGDREGSYEKSTNILDSWKEFENAFNT